MSTKLYGQVVHLLAFAFIAVLTGMGQIDLASGLGILGSLTGLALGLSTTYVVPPTTPTSTSTATKVVAP
jgi:hypothetical protein